MPNTLAHIGVQLPLFRRLMPAADPRWIVLGLLIPDLPWILQRILISTTTLDPVQVRAYVVSMSAPFFCLLLSAAISLPFRRRWQVFGILSVHCVLHLVLDSLQDKAHLGVLFLAPLHWQTYQWELFSMDGWVSILLTLLGALTLLSGFWGGLKFPGIALDAHCRMRTWFTSLLLAITYLWLPVFCMETVIASNVHDLRVWDGSEQRTGQVVHFDRAWYAPGTEVGIGSIRSAVSRDPVAIEGIHQSEPALVSTTAIFRDEETLLAGEVTVHPPQRRFYTTLLGLLGILWIWLLPHLPWYPNQSNTA